MKNRYFVFLVIFLCCNSCQAVNSGNSSTQNNHFIDIAQAQAPSNSQMLPITAQAVIKESIIELEVAQTPEQQSTGLMFREALPDNRGMFFPFDQARIARFWMNNVPVALDMVFIKEGKVIAIVTAPPCETKPQDCPLYGPDTDVDGVIELRAGRAKELGLKIGDLIVIRSLDNSQQN